MNLPRIFRPGFATPLVVMLAITRCVAANPVSFATPVAFNSGALGANSVVMADVNGDGSPDMVVATNNGVSVFLNTGSPGSVSFNAPVTYATGGSSSQSVSVADINNDGNMDLVVTNMCVEGQALCSGVAVLLGNGDGTFQAAIGSDSGGFETGAVAVADLNGDGNLDLVLTNNCQLYTCAGGTLTWLAGNGDGTFKPAIDLTATKGGPIVIGDVNNDSCPDLVTGGGVLLNNKTGSLCTGNFTLSSDNIPGGAVSIALADVNGDHHLDLVVAYSAGVGIQLGNGDGTFQPAVTYKTGGVFPLSVAVSDLNGDGFVDLAVANECSSLLGGVCYGAGTVGVLAGKGDGTFKTAVIFRPTGEFTTSVALADVDGDGRLDLAASDACSGIGAGDCANGSVSIFLNNLLTLTSTKLVSSANPTTVDQQVTYTATVTGTASNPPDDGSSLVTFTAGGTTIATKPTVHGVASVTTSFAAKGTTVVQASYQGDVFHKPSSGKLTEVVNGAPSTTTLTSSMNPSNNGQNVMLKAVVASSVGSTPTGKVTFYSGTTSLGGVTLDNTGTASLNTSKLAVGSDSLTAVYGGDAQNAKNTSNVVVQTVNP